MGPRFQRHLSLLPGIRVNVSKTGASLSIGHRGAWYTIGPRGQRATVGLPGTELSWTGYRCWHPHGPERPPAAGRLSRKNCPFSGQSKCTTLCVQSGRAFVHRAPATVIRGMSA
jgi:hypothetical protein